jgi:hypothetical protein
MQRCAAAIAAALLSAPTPSVAQTTEKYSSWVPGDGVWIEDACFFESYKSPKYSHSVLGETPEWTAMMVFYGPEAIAAADGHREWNEARAGTGHIFEDIAPRLADLDGDGRQEIVVVQSAFDRGARLVVYAITPEPQLLAATPFIGQPHRWLAPAGIADFDGDGQVEIAYVDRPHLLAELVFVRLEGDRLVETLRLPGLTNHRIGEDVISGGLRDCGAGPELVLASKDWTRVMRVHSGVTEDIGPMPSEGLTIPPC